MENNLASIFITHLDDINDAGFKFFTYLYECKKLMLMLENLYGELTTNLIPRSKDHGFSG